MRTTRPHTPRSAVAAVAGSIVLALGAPGCDTGAADLPVSREEAPAPSVDPLRVFVVNYPLMYITERISGAHAEVAFPAPAGIDPATWQPDAEVISQYQSADIILANGAGYAGWMAMASLPESKVVNTGEAFAADVIVEEGTVAHSHGPEGEHSHGETAFTTWLDLNLATRQAESVAAALSAARPSHAADFQRNLAALRASLEGLDGRLLAAGAGAAGLPLLASHPVYQYLARRYGLNLESVHFEPGEYPGEEAWEELEQLHLEHPSATMLWEDEPLPETVQRLRGMGIESIVFAPAGNRPQTGDFLEVMEANIRNLERRVAK